MSVLLSKLSHKLIAVKTLLFVATVMISLSACNTIEGVGEDLGAAAKKIEKEANKQKKY